MGVTTTQTNKPFNPRGNDQSPLAFNRAKLYSGKALDFDGVNDSIDISNFSLNGYTAFSICFHKTDDFNTGMIFSSADSISDGVNIYQVSPGYFRARLNGVNVVDTTLNVSTEEGFFVFTYDGTNAKWYYQAQNIDSGTTSQTFAISNTTSTIARQSYAAAQYLNGQIAGFKIFNTALTAAQVADLYNNPEKVVPTGVDNTALKLFLPMQEGAGTTAYDGSGNANHGTISGATYTHGIGAPVSQTAVISWNKATNKVTNSYDLSGILNTTSGVTFNYAEAPDGTQTATRFVAGFDFNLGNIGVDGDTRSLWIRATSGSGDVMVGARYTAPYDLITLTEEWQRVERPVVIGQSGEPLFYLIDFRHGGTTITDVLIWCPQVNVGATADPTLLTIGTAQTSPVLLPQGLTTGRDITGVNLFENVRKQGALNLDGNSWAEVHDNTSLDVTTGLTLESWVYFDGSTNTAGILDKYHYSVNKRSYDLRRDTSGNVQFTISSNGADNLFLSYTGSQISTGWHHVLATYDQVNQKLYVDGVLNNSASATISIYNSDKPVTIGVLDPAVSSSIFNSPIAQPRIYNRALTAAEVQKITTRGKTHTQIKKESK